MGEVCVVTFKSSDDDDVTGTSGQFSLVDETLLVLDAVN